MVGGSIGYIMITRAANYNERARRAMENDGGQGTRSRGEEKEVREINEVRKLKVEPSRNREFEREQIRMAV